VSETVRRPHVNGIGTDMHTDNSKEVVERFRLARGWVAYHRPYYSELLFSLIPIYTPRVPTVGVDRLGRIYVSPKWVDKLWGKYERQEDAVKALAAVLVHEVNHVLRDHHDRAEAIEASPAVWNKAGDAEINDDLRSDVSLPEPCIFPEAFGLPPHEIAEVYYRQLMENSTSQEDSGSQPQDGSGAGGESDEQEGDEDSDGDVPPQSQDGSGAGGESDEQEGDEDSDGDVPPQAQCGSGAGGEPGDWEVSEEDAPFLDATALDTQRRLTAQAITQHEAERGIGSVPAGLSRWASKVLTPQVRWDQELAALLRAHLGTVSGCSESSWTRRSRRQDAVQDVILPGMVRRLPRIGVIIDSSGSMSDDDLARALTELDGILRTTEHEAWVVSCDTSASEPEAIRGTGQLAQTLQGGGGTDLRVGFQAIEAVDPDVIVAFTDGYTPWPSQEPDATTIVVLIGDNPPVVPSWARALTVEA